MGRRRSDIQIFSLSLLDLLFCAMAAVTILWVLTARGEPETARSRYGFLTVSQVGIWHLTQIRVVDRSTGAVVVDVNRDDLNVEDRDAEFEKRLAAAASVLQARGLVVSLVPRKKVSAGGPAFVAAKLIVSANDQTEPTVLECAFGACTSRRDIHTIGVSIMSQSGTEQDYLIYQEDAAYEQAKLVAVMPRPMGERRVKTSTTSPLTAGQERLLLQFEIDGGELSFKRPPSK